jgi:hypothetical protein
MLLAPMTRDMISRPCALLYERIERHDEEAAEDTDQPQVEQHSPRTGLVSELERAERDAGRGVRRREVEIDREYGQPDRAERHETDLDLVPRQPLAEQRAQTHTRREDHEQQRDDLLAAAEHALRVERQLREHERAIEPEPRDAEYRQEHRAHLARRAQVVQRRCPRFPVDP